MSTSSGSGVAVPSCGDETPVEEEDDTDETDKISIGQIDGSEGAEGDMLYVHPADGRPPPMPVIRSSRDDPPARILASRRSRRIRACSEAADGEDEEAEAVGAGEAEVDGDAASGISMLAMKEASEEDSSDLL